MSSLMILCGVLAAPPADPPTTTSAPATQAARVVKFKPGVQIHWPQRQVEVDARVVLRHGYLELFACSPQTKEHESILCVHARPYHIYQAMGLLGLQPGKPVGWDPKTEKVILPTGDRLELFVRYKHPKTGKVHTDPVHTWMRDAASGKTMPATHWLFTGSQKLDDGSFYADTDGTVVAVVDFSSSLISLSGSRSASNDQLTLEPDPERIPPVQTKVALIIRRATPDGIRIDLDRFGRLSIGKDRYGPQQLQQRLALWVRRNPDLQVILRAEPTTAYADVQAAIELIHKAGVKKAKLSVVNPTEDDQSRGFPPHDPQAAGELLAAHVQVGQSLLDQLSRQQQRLVEGLNDRRQRLVERSTQLARSFEALRHRVESLRDLDDEPR